ncbi:MAG: class I adenylate-forming enzyme family protein [Rhodospirillaceae bacterium]
MTEPSACNGTFFGWMERNARLSPDKPAIVSIDQDRTITHGELFRVANRIGRHYADLGIGRNDRVALLSNNSIEHLIVYLASLAYGCTVCTIHVEMNAIYFEEILTSVNAKLVLCEDDQPELEKLAGKVPGDWRRLGDWTADGGDGFFSDIAGLAETPGDWPVCERLDDASIFYTSGTAAKPKGVVCTMAELYDNTIPIADGFGMTADDRMLDYRSMNWMSAQVLSALGPVAKGATLLLARKFSAGRFFDWINRYGATMAAGNPTIINMLVNRDGARGREAAPTLRFITSSSAPLLVSEWQRFEETFGIRVCQGYGTSESGWIAGSSETSRKLGSVGRPLPYQQVRIVDRDGNPLPPDEIGAIQLNGNPAGCYRYLADDGSIRINAEGSTLTGDLGFLDREGYLFVTGREKDLIIRGGVNISPLEIDNVVLQLPGVADVATVGVPDTVYGEQVVVYLSLQDGAVLGAEEIIAHCGRHLAPFKMPKEVIFRRTLPKTERGKMDRNALAAEWRAARAPA